MVPASREQPIIESAGNGELESLINQLGSGEDIRDIRRRNELPNIARLDLEDELFPSDF